MTEARLTHWDFFLSPSRHLLVESNFGNMLGLGKRGRKVVEELETMIMGFMSWECRSSCLQIEVNESCWSRLQLRLVKRIHSVELCRVESMIVKRSFTCLVFAWLWIKGAESISRACLKILLIPLCEEFFVFPHFIQNFRALVWSWVSFYWFLLLR